VLRQRTRRITLVLGNLGDSFNQQATIRTAESMGVQYIYHVRSKSTKQNQVANKILKGSKTWITLKSFASVEECVAALKSEGQELWVLQQGRFAHRYPSQTIHPTTSSDETAMTASDPAASHGAVAAPAEAGRDEEGQITVPLPLEPILFASHAHACRRGPTERESASFERIQQQQTELARSLFQDPSKVQSVDYDGKNERYTILNPVVKRRLDRKDCGREDTEGQHVDDDSMGTASRSAEPDASKVQRVLLPPFPYQQLLEQAELTADTTNGLSILGFPSRVALVVGTEGGAVHPTFGRAATRHVYFEHFGLTMQGFSLSAGLAIVLDRLFALCPEARGDLTPAERAEIRERWYANLTSNAEQHAEFNRYLPFADKIPLLQDIRVEDSTKTPYKLKKVISKANRRNARAGIILEDGDDSSDDGESGHDQDDSLGEEDNAEELGRENASQR